MILNRIFPRETHKSLANANKEQRTIIISLKTVDKKYFIANVAI